MSHDGRFAVVWAENVCLVDTFQFAGANLVPSTASFYAIWHATGPRKRLGMGGDVPPTDPAAFRGRFAPARAYGWFSGKELGFSFESKGLADSDRGYASLGRERNGEFLKEDWSD